MSKSTMHGEVIAWDIKTGTKIRYADLLAAMDATGLNKAVAKEMAPRNAFTRAIADLSANRVIRKIEDTATFLRFQFTRETVTEAADGKRLDYNFEAVLVLNKVTGAVQSDTDPNLAALAEKMLKDESEVRYNCDITRIVQRLFEMEADLFPVRSQGGCYFVPAAFAGFCEKVEAFLASVGGSLRRFPVPAAVSASADRSVKESVDDGLNAMLAEHLKAIDEFDDSTREKTLEKMVERINGTRFKIEAYAEYLGEKKAELDEAVKAARAALRLKVLQLGKAQAVKVPEPVATPAA